MEAEKSLKSETDKKPSGKRLIIFGAGILLLLLIFVFVFTFLEQNKPNRASESIIRRAAARKLNKDPNELTDNDFARITELRVTSYELLDIELLKEFINLEELDLSHSRYQKKKPNWLVSLEQKIGIYDPYRLYKTTVLDLSPLKKLIRLRNLNISYTLIKDIKPLAGLTRLESLNLSNTQISDFKLLAGFTNLVSLNLAGTKLSDITPIVGLTKLKSLDLSNTQISDFKSLAKLTKLESLTLNNSQISDFGPLKELTNMRILRIQKCKNLSHEQVKELERALPDLNIQRFRLGWF